MSKQEHTSNATNGDKPLPLLWGEGRGEGEFVPGVASVPRPTPPHSKQVAIARDLRKHDTWAEKLVWTWLRDRRFSAYKFRRQHRFGAYILDFFCVQARVDIELDGCQHGYPTGLRTDAERDSWLEAHGVKVLRFWNSRLRRDQQFIRDLIWRTLQERALHPLPGYSEPGARPQDRKARLG